MQNRTGKKAEFLSLSELQAYLGIKSRKTILKYISSGKLSAYKMGGTRWKFVRKDVDNFLRGQFVGDAAEGRR